MKGLVLVYTGNGKGKTTAALGLLVRATGHGKKCCMIQFIKSASSNYGEHKTLPDKLEIACYSMGAGCTWTTTDPTTLHTIEEAWEFSKKQIFSGTYDIIVLDEINIALNFLSKHPDSLDLLGELTEAIRKKPENLHLVLTGRYAPPEIIDLADAATEMNCLKHHYDKGVPAMPGIEF
jgi:cob(I)alamin adenosyltransferase